MPLNASVASLSSDVLSLKDDYDNPGAGAGAKLLAPLYRGGELEANVSVRTAQQREALVRYAGLDPAGLVAVIVRRSTAMP